MKQLKVTFSFLFCLSGTASIEYLYKNHDWYCDDEDEHCHDIQEEILRPAEVVSDRPHAGVVRMSEEVLQPPDRPLQRVLGLVHDQLAQPRH